ncbi:MAG: hypothetical protein Q7U04_05380, partial [Bacteriovorax sp.]|nr:hypothetical protein [Bacteriovorax sp.]
MQKFIILCLIALLFGCAKDKNMDDLRRDQLQEKTERINSVSGAYSGAVISEIDGSNLGNIQLKFKASTDIQSSSGNVSNTQNVKVSGTLSLKSLSNADVSFDNGTYDDVTGAFQAIIAVADINGAAIAKISLGGNISGDRWTGS